MTFLEWQALGAVIFIIASTSVATLLLHTGAKKGGLGDYPEFLAPGLILYMLGLFTLVESWGSIGIAFFGVQP